MIYSKQYFTPIFTKIRELQIFYTRFGESTRIAHEKYWRDNEKDPGHTW